VEALLPYVTPLLPRAFPGVSYARAIIMLFYCTKLFNIFYALSTAIGQETSTCWSTTICRRKKKSGWHSVHHL